jgi:hypothetical protein
VLLGICDIAAAAQRNDAASVRQLPDLSLTELRLSTFLDKVSATQELNFFSNS